MSKQYKSGEELDAMCNCSHECSCGENCECTPDNKCNENCTCGENCDCECDNECGKNCNCVDDACENCECESGESETQNQDEYFDADGTTIDNVFDVADGEVDNCNCNNNYLKDYQRVQAEFDNYRKRMQTALLDARHDGFMEAIEGFLPALDSFKMATDMITDKNTLMGIKFIEKGILDTLSKMGVEAIDATGMFNPELHQAIDTDDSPDAKSGEIIKEAYKGFTYKGKVIRYSQVIVKR